MIKKIIFISLLAQGICSHATTPMLALLAGAGPLPIEAAQKLTRAQKPFCIFSLAPEDNMQLLKNVVSPDTKIIPIHTYKAGSILKLFTSHGITQIFFTGKVERKNLISKIRPDWFGIKLVSSFAFKSNQQIIATLVSMLKKHNISLVSQAELFASLQLPRGTTIGEILPHEYEDIKIGIAAARILGRTKISRLILIKNGKIIAIQGAEDLEACINRAYELAGNGLVICYADARDQTSQEQTSPLLTTEILSKFPKSAVRIISWQAKKNQLMNPECFIAQAAENGIALHSW